MDFTNRFIYYVGPVDPVRDEVVGPAGPTTATRMDKFTRQMLKETGLLGMVGKSERGPAAIEAIRDHKAVYLMAVGGAAYLVSKAIKKSRVVAFHDLGMEAIYEFEVQDMPVTVAVDSKGNSVHESGPKEWQAKIAELVEIGRLSVRRRISCTLSYECNSSSFFHKGSRGTPTGGFVIRACQPAASLPGCSQRPCVAWGQLLRRGQHPSRDSRRAAADSGKRGPQVRAPR